MVPELRLGPGEHALYHRQGGTVLAEAGLDAMAAAATRLGAELASPERAVSVEQRWRRRSRHDHAPAPRRRQSR